MSLQNEEESVLVQKWPELVVQSELPHLQSVPSVFVIVPFVLAHVVGGRGEQELEDLTQYEPAAVHPLVPQIQPAVFGSFPLIFVHSGADRQRQEEEEEQDVVEEESVL